MSMEIGSFLGSFGEFAVVFRSRTRISEGICAF